MLTTLLPLENSLAHLIVGRLVQSSRSLIRQAYCFVRNRYF